MPLVEVDIAVWCTCGAGICHLADGGNGRITVEPCDVCMSGEYERGKEEGYQLGYNSGLEDAEETQ